MHSWGGFEKALTKVGMQMSAFRGGVADKVHCTAASEFLVVSEGSGTTSVLSREECCDWLLTSTWVREVGLAAHSPCV